MKGRDLLVGLLGAVGGAVVGVAVFGYADPLTGAIYGVVGGAVATAIYRGIRSLRGQ